MDRPRRPVPRSSSGCSTSATTRSSPAAPSASKGEVVEILHAYMETAYRINLFGDEIESIHHFDPLTGEVLDEVDHVAVWPASHYVTEEDTLVRAMVEIKQEMDERIAFFEEQGQAARGAPPAQRTEYDIEMLERAGASTSGIENYSRIFDGRAPGSAPAHADRLLPRRLRRLRRRVPPDDPADRRHVRGRPLAQADPGRARIPPAVGDGQPPAEVRRIPRPGRPGGPGLGDAGRVRAHVVAADRRADRPPDRDRRPRGRGARDRATRSTT